MDSLCDNLIIAIFQFVQPDDRFRFIMLGKKYYNAVSNYITTPEWIYEQIDKFIKKNVVVDFSLKCYGPEEYHEYMQKHEYNRQSRGADDFFAKQLEVGTMRCQYINSIGCYDCASCDSCNWIPRWADAQTWKLNFVQNAPSNYLAFNDYHYRKYVADSIKGQSSIKYYAYWSDDGNHTSDIIMIGHNEIVEYSRGCPCISGSLMPIHSIYESIGIIVHNMTGIEQIHKNLLDYDIEHLQLFYIINFIASGGIFDILNGSCDEQKINILQYFLFVEHVLQNHICKNVETLMITNRVGPSKYVFMIHPEIDSKAADAAKYLILFGTE